MESARSVIASLKQEEFLASVNIQDAYFPSGFPSCLSECSPVGKPRRFFFFFKYVATPFLLQASL